MPKFSIIMNAYNVERYIEEAVYSVLNQKFQDFEIILIDDVSTDGTWNLISQIVDNRLKKIRREKNGMIYYFNTIICVV